MRYFDVNALYIKNVTAWEFVTSNFWKGLRGHWWCSSSMGHKLVGGLGETGVGWSGGNGVLSKPAESHCNGWARTPLTIKYRGKILSNYTYPVDKPFWQIFLFSNSKWIAEPGSHVLHNGIRPTREGRTVFCRVSSDATHFIFYRW